MSGSFNRPLYKRERAAVLNQGERKAAQPHSDTLVGGTGAFWPTPLAAGVTVSGRSARKLALGM